MFLFFLTITYYLCYLFFAGYERAFIVCKVLINNCVAGSPNMKFPPENYDTGRGNTNVHVKFHDNEFLPLYVINYYAPDRSTSKHHRHRIHYQRLLLF